VFCLFKDCALETIYFQFFSWSQLELNNCIGFDHLQRAGGTVCIYVVSSNERDLEGLKIAGAMVNKMYAGSWAAFWQEKDHGESFLDHFLITLGSAAVGGLGGGVGGAVAYGVSAWLAHNQPEEKKQ
jgi:hypothetical protein